MVFLNNDFYTASGSVKLYNSWTDKVTKFDTSAFYNWEQDNLPIYDLEERTYHLWEQLGHPTSALPGVVLVVSGGGSSEYYESYRNTFETVSAAVAALPQVLNYPVIIEICNKGNLGELNLKNIKCGPKGSLEIVNKVFAKQEPEFNGSSLNNINRLPSEYYLAVSAISGVDSSLTYSVPFTARKHFQSSISEFLNLSIFTGTSLAVDIFGMVCPIGEGRNSKATYFISSTGADTVSLNSIKITPFETTTDALDNHYVSSQDFSAISIVEGTDYITTAAPETDALMARYVGLFYANKFTKVLVTNCDGPIYLRNFFVDDNNITTKNAYGIEVTNSRNVYLENCIATRHSKAGFYFNNSKIIITRGIGAYRNYSTTPARVSNNIFETNLFDDSRDSAAGLYALNSEIQFSSTAAFERTLFETDKIFSAVSSYGSLSYGLNYPLNFSRNANGIILENSKMFGGIYGASGTNLVCELNNRCGIKLLNSTFEWDGRVKTRQNNVGLFSVNSNLVLDRASFLENTLRGVSLINSNLLYNKNSIVAAGAEDQFYYDNNGKHLSLINSIYSYNKDSSMPDVLGAHEFLNSYAKSILIQESSKCVLVHPKIRSKNILETGGKFGDPISVENNSKLVLKGSKTYATTVVGRQTTANQNNTAGIYINNNSTADIQGPTVLAQHSVNVLAENNSVLNIIPHKDDAGSLETDSFNLSDSGNHTMVELHSTRACLVANKNSVINVEDLGSYNLIWSDSESGSSIIDTADLDYNVTSFESFVSGGFLQFYPNPLGESTRTFVTNGTNVNFSPAGNSYYYLLNRNTAAFNEYSAITYGGMCVRAVNDSVVNVKNVNFPAGHWNPSGVFYNATADSIAKMCSLLFIWNIADSSKLNASYCSVSSLYPTDAGYCGPLAVWLSSLSINGILSGEPVPALAPWINDPYVSGYALLDYFGSGPNAGSSIFTSSNLNQGVFRLYFSTDPAVNELGLVSTGVYASLSGAYFSGGWIPQVFAQGYYPPGYMSATSSVSGMHKTLLRYTTTGPNKNICLSGLYRPVGIDDPNQSTFDYIVGAGLMHDPLSTRVFLDESAASIFANAKHCATGKSGAPKVVSIYYPYGNGSGDSNYVNKDVGIGLGSVNNFDLTRNN